MELEAQAAKWIWPTTAPKPTTVPTKTKAAIYYLSSPDGVPGSNETEQWQPTSDQSKLLGEIDVTNATWVNNKNVVSNVSNCITKWPDETTGSSWTVRRTDKKIEVDNKTYFNYILDSIWEKYKENVSKKLQVTDLTEDDVTEITLEPFKISRANSNTENQYYHIDCTINIKCSKVFAAKFWVKEPGSNDYKLVLVDATNYKKDSSVIKTSMARIGSTKEIDGITYILDGWYPESDLNGNDNNSKISNERWPYSPEKTELADGTVNFYAHYIPLYTTVNIKKIVTGNMGDKSKAFQFKVSVINGTIKLPFNIGETQYRDSADIALSDNQTTTLTKVPVGATVTITEDDYRSSRYETSYTINNSVPCEGRIATISDIQQLNKNTAHEVTLTNNKDAIPDTGLDFNTTPYILVLGIVVAGAGVLLFGRRKRWSRRRL